ncbi:MAG: response regulator [Acidobacteriota bacterium]
MRLELESVVPKISVTEIIKPQVAPANNFAAEAKELLAEGIRAAQSGDRVSARVSLLRSSELDANIESTWLWLASISEYPEELLVFLSIVLEINPESQRAIEWTAATKSLLSKTFVQRGIDAAEENKADYAAQCFNQALEYDQTNSMAWLWMASLCDSNDGKITYFESVLSIDPANETAQNGLRSARREISQCQLAEARAAAVAGKSADANEFLDAIIAENPDSEDAWILRAHIAEGFDRKILAFQKVLQLNPANVTAKSGLESLLSIIETVAPNQSAASITDAVSEAPAVEAEPRDESEAEVDTHDDEFVPALHTGADAETIAAVEPAVEEVVDSPFERLETVEASEADEVPRYLSDEGHSPDDHESTGREYTSGASAFFETAVEWKAQPVEEFVTEFEVHLDLPEPAAEIEVRTSDPDSPEVGGFEPELQFEMQALPEDNDSEAEWENSIPTDEPVEPDEYFAQDTFEQLLLTENYSQPAESSDSLRDAITVVSEDVCDSVREMPAPATEAAFDHVTVMPLSSSVVSIAHEGNTFSHVTFCSFCNDENDVQAIVCRTCNAVLSLSDLELLIANTAADKLMLRTAVERVEAEKLKRELSEAELTMLAIGHLNLHNYPYGLNYLVQASDLNPNNVVLSSQVNGLRIRLDEMKRRDEVHDAKPKGKTILIVDDSPTVRKLIAGKLEKCGHDVVCAGDGVEAIECLEDLVPDLVLLDITMPRMDGYQVCKMIRSNTATQDVPVVMISGKDGFFDKVRGRMAGTTGYITKPFGPETLMKAVETYLSQDAGAEQVN